MLLPSAIIRIACFTTLLATAAWGQTFYSPNGVGAVGNDSPSGTGKNRAITSADIFAWDINANSTASGFDTYTGSSNSDLDINGSGVEVFRVVFGASVDTNNTFWDTDQTWTAFITASGNGTIPDLTQATVEAYTYSGGSYSLVDTSARGSFSISSNNLSWTAVPEPTNALVGLLLLCGFLRRRRSH